MAGSIRAARNDTPERSAIVHGWATRPATLTGAPCRMAAEGTPGTLTGIRSALSSPMTSSWTTNSGSPFSSALGRRVSKSTTGSGAIAHRNAIADVSIGSFTGCLLSAAPRGERDRTRGAPQRPRPTDQPLITRSSVGPKPDDRPNEVVQCGHSGNPNGRQGTADGIPSGHQVAAQRTPPSPATATGLVAGGCRPGTVRPRDSGGGAAARRERHHGLQLGEGPAPATAALPTTALPALRVFR